jgi:hypothetical protein
MELLQPLHERFPSENPIRMWMSVDGAFGVASSLGAGLLRPGLTCGGRCVAFGGRRWLGCGLLGGGGSPVVVLKEKEKGKKVGSSFSLGKLHERSLNY